MGNRLLWIEDDEPGRFVYEERLLTRQGWVVTWAPSVEDAARSLSKNVYDAILLDQMIAPVEVRGHLVMWSGCRLLYWLRQSTADPPWPQEDPSWWVLHELTPLEQNRSCPVTLVSAYRNAALLDATRRASALDHGLKTFAKPIDVDTLLAHLGSPR